MLNESVAVMQPYFFPNLSYYKLVRHVEHFIFYDDVHYIKGGWINRNNILYNEQPLSFTLPLKEASSNKVICDIEVFNKEREANLFLKKIAYSYSKAPYYKDVLPVIESVLGIKSNLIAEVAEQSIIQVFNYLNLPIETSCSSKLIFDRSADDKTDRLISLIHFLNKKVYLNAIGGKALYDKHYFKNKGIDLFFISPSNTIYHQFNHSFIPNLSMIDVLMFNSRADVIGLLDFIEYE